MTQAEATVPIPCEEIHFSVAIVDDVQSLCSALGGLLRAAGLNPVFFQRQTRPVKAYEGYTGPITISAYQRFQWIREALKK